MCDITEVEVAESIKKFAKIYIMKEKSHYPGIKKGTTLQGNKEERKCKLNKY